MIDLSGLVPYPHLQTARLALRQVCANDAKALMAVFGDPDVTITTDIDPFERVEQVTEFMVALNRRYESKQAIRWAITLKGDDTLIGTVGYNYFNEESGRCEIGYDLARALWNKGYITEAVRAVVNFGFERLAVNRIEATTNLFNVGSIRVLHKVGFREEGILYQYGFWRGQHHDLRMHSLLRKDWTHTDES